MEEKEETAKQCLLEKCGESYSTERSQRPQELVAHKISPLVMWHSHSHLVKHPHSFQFPNIFSSSTKFPAQTLSPERPKRRFTAQTVDAQRKKDSELEHRQSDSEPESGRECRR